MRHFTIVTFELSSTVKQETGEIIFVQPHPLHKTILVARVDPAFGRLPAHLAAEQLKLAFADYDFTQDKEKDCAK